MFDLKQEIIEVHREPPVQAPIPPAEITRRPHDDDNLLLHMQQKVAHGLALEPG